MYVLILTSMLYYYYIEKQIIFIIKFKIEYFSSLKLNLYNTNIFYSVIQDDINKLLFLKTRTIIIN